MSRNRTRAAAVKAGAKLPKDHAVKHEALDQPVKVTVGTDVINADHDLTISVPREIVDSYEAINAAYSGFVMPIIQQFAADDRAAVLDAAKDEQGVVRNSAVQKIVIAALTQAAQGE